MSKSLLSLTRKPSVSRKAALLLAVGGAAIIVMTASPSFAQDVFGTLQTKSTTVFTNVRNLSYVLGAFGLIAIAVMAFFGRFNWKHLGGLIAGLILIAAAAGFINFATTNSNSSSTSSTATYTDTMTGGGAQ